MAYDQLVTAIASAGVGFGVAIHIAKLAIAKTLQDLARVITTVGELQKTLVEFSVRLEALTAHDAILKQHEKKFAFYEGRGCKSTEK
jgi:hypothetical protein